MAQYWRLLKGILRGIRMSYGVWQIDECHRRDPEHVYQCATCGVANLPCEHWLKMLQELENSGG